MTPEPLLTAIVPAFNEEAGIRPALEGLSGALQALAVSHEILVVDDGSADGTAREVAALAALPGLRVLRHARNRGYGASIKTAGAEARGELVLFYDADGQFRPEDLPALLEAARTADMAAGARDRDSDQPLLRRPGKRVLVWTANYLARERIPDLNCGYRIVRRAVLRRYLHLLPDGFSASTTLTLLLLRGGHDVRFVPVRVVRRMGRSTVNIVGDGMETLMLIVRLVTLLDPLRVFLPASGLFLGLGLLWGIRYLALGRGLSSAALFLLISGVLTFLIGLLADQVAALRREAHR
jgi:glycosyltransferase involved in cell wall biosynthesis